MYAKNLPSVDDVKMTVVGGLVLKYVVLLGERICWTRLCCMSVEEVVFL